MRPAFDEDAYEIYVAQVRANYERCRHEFARPYVGGDTIPQQLQTYVAACARQYAAVPTRFRAPLVSIVQSSGFGKSRLLRELARCTKDDEMAPMKVLYTCVRPSSVVSSGYPAATVSLRDYLFPSVESGDRDPEPALTARLVDLYTYAWSQWQSVGPEWFVLFDDQADAAIRQRLEMHTVVVRQSTTARHDSIPPIEEPRVLVVAIDEARYLLETDNKWNRRLFGALVAASRQIRATFGRHAGIVAVVIDTSPSIIGRYDEPESGSLGRELFPPFVLTHTMDIRFAPLIEKAKCDGVPSKRFYQELVARAYDDAWPALVAMGRPLWDRAARENVREKEAATATIQLAATKLLGGVSVTERKNFNEASMFGVASVLCRVGLQPSSWSRQLASRLVGGFMCTLMHVSVSHDQLVTSYTSEPLLTFGAARVWYQAVVEGDKHAVLAELILPTFRQLLYQGAVRTGGKPCVENIVGRLMLLLVMDATGAVGASNWRAYEYAGAFHSVETFLHVLYGASPLVVRDGQLHDATSQVIGDVEAMLRSWREWRVGFSHFVCLLHEPSEDELWAMLARRAAGVLPREYDHVDLVIPIFYGTAVSMVLVQVDTRASDSNKMWLAACMMRPSAVFTNEWNQRRPEEVVRVYLNLSGTDGRKTFYFVDEGARPHQADEATATEAYVLCLEGLDAWSARRVKSYGGVANPFGRRETIPVLSSGVASELRKLIQQEFDDMALMEEDMDRRKAHGRVGVDDDAVRSIVSRPKVPSLLSAWPPADSSANREPTDGSK